MPNTSEPPTDQLILGSYLRSFQGKEIRHGYMQLLAELVFSSLPRRTNFRILEVGSWAGGSAITWANSLEKYGGRRGRVICIDPWRPYLDTELNSDPIYTLMDTALQEEAIYDLFRRNVQASGYGDMVSEIRAASADVLPLLKRNSFDIVFIDGNHEADSVRTDITLAKPLLRDGGILCGDDLEAQLHEVDKAYLAALDAKVDLAEDPKSGKKYHPGVTVAVAETLGKVSAWDGLWGVRKNGRTFENIDLNVSSAEIPDHLNKVNDDQLKPHFVEALHTYNIVDGSFGYIAVRQDLGDVQLEIERFGLRDRAPFILVDEDLESLRSRVNGIVEAEMVGATATQDTISRQEIKIADLEEVVGELMSEMGAREKKIIKIEDELEKKKGNIVAQAEIAKALKTEKAEILGRFDQMKSDIDQQLLDLAEKNRVLTRMADSIPSMKNIISNMSGKLDAVSKKLHMSEKSLRDYGDLLRNSDDQITQSKEQIEKYEIEIDRLNKTIEAQRTEARNTQDKLSDLENRLAEEARSSQERSIQIQAMTNQIADMEKAQQDLSKENRNLRVVANKYRFFEKVRSAISPRKSS